MIRRLALLLLLAFSPSFLRADGYSDILNAVNALKTAFNNFATQILIINNNTDNTVDDISDNTVTIIESIEFLKESLADLQACLINIDDNVATYFPQVSETAGDIRDHFTILNGYALEMLDLLPRLQAAVNSNATANASIAQDTSDIAQEIATLAKESTQWEIHTYVYACWLALDGLTSATATLGQYLQQIDLRLRGWEDWFEYWNQDFYLQFHSASVPYTSLGWYRITGAPYLKPDFKPTENTAHFGSGDATTFFSDLAAALTTVTIQNADIANSLVYICSVLSQSNLVQQATEDEFRSDFSSAVSSARTDKDTLEHMTFDFNVNPPRQFDDLNVFSSQVRKYSVNQYSHEDFIIQGLQGFSTANFNTGVSQMSSHMYFSDFEPVFNAARCIMALVYWGIFMYFVWWLFLKVLRLFAFFRFYTVNQSGHLFMHTDDGHIV